MTDIGQIWKQRAEKWYKKSMNSLWSAKSNNRNSESEKFMSEITTITSKPLSLIIRSSAGPMETDRYLQVRKLSTTWLRNFSSTTKEANLLWSIAVQEWVERALLSQWHCSKRSLMKRHKFQCFKQSDYCDNNDGEWYTHFLNTNFCMNGWTSW